MFDDSEVKKIDLNWINRFKSRHSILSRKLCGEAETVDKIIVSEWRTNLLPTILNQYQLRDIFNVDEMGLFCRCFQEKTQVFKG